MARSYRGRLLGGLALALFVAVTAAVLATRRGAPEPSPDPSPEPSQVQSRERAAQSDNADAAAAMSSSSMLAAYKNNPTEALGQELAQALLSAGEYEDLLTYLAGDPPILVDATANALYRAEALVNLHRYDDALGVANQLIRDGAETQYASLAAAKSHYGLGDFTAARQQLLTALRAPPEIAGQAWMFRARIALEENAVSQALTAIERAREIGVPPALLETIKIEADLRSGDLQSARAALAPRLAATRTDEATLDIEAIRLAAMERAIAGDFTMAGREIDSIAPWVDHHLRGPLLRAALKMMAGDRSQAEYLVRDHLAYAPRDWVALDLLLDIRLPEASPEEVEAMISRLTAANALRGNLRRYDYQRSNGELAAAAQAFREAASGFEIAAAAAPIPASALSFLLGTALPSAGDPLSHADYQLLTDLARSLDGAPQDAMKRAGEIAAASNDPVALILAGDIALVGGDVDLASRAFERGADLRAGDFAFVDRKVRVLLRRNDSVGARTLLDVFLLAHPDAIEARLTASRIALYQGGAAAARQYFSKTPLAELFANDGAVLHLASVYAEQGDADALDALCRESKKQIAGTLTQARLYALAGDQSAGAAAYRSALMSAPDNMEAAREYARLMIEADRAGEALSFLDRLSRSYGAPTGEKKMAEFEEILAGLRRQADGGDHPGAESVLAGTDRGAESVSQKAALAAYAREPEDALALFYYGNLLPPSPASNRTGMLIEACIFGAGRACATLRGEKPGG